MDNYKNYEDTGYNSEDLPGAMDDWDENLCSQRDLMMMMMMMEPHH